MPTYTISTNETALDITIMASGTLENAMLLMAATNTSISALPVAGFTFIIPDTILPDAETLLYLQQNGIVLGTKGGL